MTHSDFFRRNAIGPDTFTFHGRLPAEFNKADAKRLGIDDIEHALDLVFNASQLGVMQPFPLHIQSDFGSTLPFYRHAIERDADGDAVAAFYRQIAGVHTLIVRAG